MIDFPDGMSDDQISAVMRKQYPPTAASSQPTGLADPKGYASSFIRNAANAATFNLADPAAAAVGALFPIKGWTSTKPTYGERYQELLNLSRGDTAAGQQAHPIFSLGSSIIGGALNPVAHALPIPKTLGGAVGQGMLVGGAYGAGGSIGTSKDLKDAAVQTGTGAAVGGAVAPVAYLAGKLIAGAKRTPEANVLHEAGVPLTVGESVGGAPQTLEDATTHIPMLGTAIKNRKLESVVGFNRAAYNRALEPLGVKYPADAPIGNAGIDKIANTIGDAYDGVFKGARLKNSDTFANNISQAVDDASNLLPKERVTSITKNINRLITGKFDQNGELSGAALQAAKNWIAEQARSTPTASIDDRATAAAYGKILDAMKNGIAESDPDKGALLRAADAAYRRFLVIQQAGTFNNTGKRAGVFTADQLGSALRSSDLSAHRGAFARGKLPMQDLVQAGQKILPSTVPDSGTAVRGLVEAAPWLLAGHAVSPGAATVGSLALGGGTALYSKSGQSLAQALMHGAPETRAALSEIPMTMLPGAIAMLSGPGQRDKLAKRLQGQSQ
ncbi:MAG TPA: hypothetical protein VG892_07785 [Terriglobales bacterium]|nr:hypothetical protein [Terriglobales bacterium]